MKKFTLFVTIDGNKCDSIEDINKITKALRRGVYESLDRNGVSSPDDISVRLVVGGIVPEDLSLDEAYTVIRQQSSKIEKLQKNHYYENLFKH